MLHLTSRFPDATVQFDAALAERVRGEFREMPGLKLTLAQAGRLWSLDMGPCRRVLRELVEAGFLSEAADGTYCRMKA